MAVLASAIVLATGATFVAALKTSAVILAVASAGLKANAAATGDKKLGEIGGYVGYASLGAGALGAGAQALGYGEATEAGKQGVSDAIGQGAQVNAPVAATPTPTPPPPIGSPLSAVHGPPVAPPTLGQQIVSGANQAFDFVTGLPGKAVASFSAADPETKLAIVTSVLAAGSEAVGQYMKSLSDEERLDFDRMKWEVEQRNKRTPLIEFGQAPTGPAGQAPTGVAPPPMQAVSGPLGTSQPHGVQPPRQHMAAPQRPMAQPQRPGTPRRY